ncbi:olfactory receptor 52B2-like [Lycodopsis pacificus]
MENLYNTSSVVVLHRFNISSENVFPAFLFATLSYMIILFCNLILILTIVQSKSLHKPMYLILLNLPINDLIGSSAFFLHMINEILTDRKTMQYSACITQAFLIHFYGTGNLLILSAMAYDRYIAICCPLRYNAIMSPKKVIIIIFLIWFINFSMIVTLILLLTRFKMCRTNIVDLYCNNPSLTKLICEDTRINNYYGLFTIVLIQGAPLSIIAYTYAQILRTCVMTNHPDARKKAFQTCGTHLVVFLILQINTAFTLITHRIQSASPYIRRVLGISVLLFPPFLDPIIYGLKTTELKRSLVMFLKRNICSSKL